MIHRFFHIGMYHMLILSGLFAFGFPIILILFSKRITENIKLCLMFAYFLVILYFTIFSKSVHTESTINLTPFWSYAKFDQADIRWQVYMNVFLYIPLGFLIPFSSNKTFIQTLTIGLCLSITIEALQYIFALGLCEIDDVIHNTLGCIIGYWYWFGLSKLSERVTKKLHWDRE